MRGLPGAGWIDVEWCGDTPHTDDFIRVYELGRGRVMAGTEAAVIQFVVGAAVWRALAGKTIDLSD